MKLLILIFWFTINVKIEGWNIIFFIWEQLLNMYQAKVWLCMDAALFGMILPAPI